MLFLWNNIEPICKVEVFTQFKRNKCLKSLNFFTCKWKLLCHQFGKIIKLPIMKGTPWWLDFSFWLVVKAKWQTGRWLFCTICMVLWTLMVVEKHFIQSFLSFSKIIYGGTAFTLSWASPAWFILVYFF